MQSRKRMVLGLVVSAAILLPPLGSAVMADGHADAVKARQQAMKDIGGHMKAIGKFVKNGEGTADEAAKHADALQVAAGNVPGLFEVEVTQEESASVAKNRAKAEIWSDWAGFEAAAGTLGEEAGKVASALRGGDVAAYGPALQSLGKNGCGGCHEKYRGPKQD